MVEHRKRQIRRRDGRFYGFRIDCEQVPILPAWVVHWVWDDPRRIPYLLVWNNSRDGQVKEAVTGSAFCSEHNTPGSRRSGGPANGWEHRASLFGLAKAASRGPRLVFAMLEMPKAKPSIVRR